MLPDAPTLGAKRVARCASLALTPCLMSAALPREITPTAGVEQSRYNLYTPELTLLAETETTGANAKAIAWEYVNFGGRPLAQVGGTSGEIRWVFTDHLGAVALVTSGGSVVLWQERREPYGHIVEHDGLTGQGTMSRGQEPIDASVAYNVYRWYSNTTGRYTQSDPLDMTPPVVPAPGERPTVNEYFEYAGSNPINSDDPLGLTPCGGCPECPGNLWWYVERNWGFGAVKGVLWGEVTYFCLSAGLRCSFSYKCETDGLEGGVWGGLGSGFVGGAGCGCGAALEESFRKGTAGAFVFLEGQTNAACKGGELTASSPGGAIVLNERCTTSKFGCKKSSSIF